MSSTLPTADILYNYFPPPGYGDTAFIYAYDPVGLTNGSDYDNRSIQIQDGDFVARYMSGMETMSEKFMVYDALIRRCFSKNIDFSTPRETGQLILPERVYPVNNAIRFDFENVALTTMGTSGGITIYGSQLVFAGVRRRLAHYSDPEPSPYTYYEKPFCLGSPGSTGTFRLTINQYGATAGLYTTPDSYQLPVRDQDFELRRIELALNSSGQASQFKIQLYDNYGNRVSNIPIMANKFFHLNPAQSAGELNFFPSPPILYKVGSFIRFDIHSLMMSPTSIPVTFSLLFHGVKRIPCQ